MLLQPMKFQVLPQWRWRRDAHYSSRTRWVLQRSVKFVLTAFAAGEQDLDENVNTLLSNVRIRQPASEFMNGWNIPSLTDQPQTLYTRVAPISGSDYENLPESVYAWKVIDANLYYNDKDSAYGTIYVIQGQWDKYQGVAYGVVRRDR
jgi:hypothetical protein